MRRAVAAGLAVACLSTPALAAPTPYDPETADQWVNPMARGDEAGDITVDITQAPDSVSEGDSLRLQLTVANSSEEAASSP